MSNRAMGVVVFWVFTGVCLDNRPGLLCGFAWTTGSRGLSSNSVWTTVSGFVAALVCSDKMVLRIARGDVDFEDNEGVCRGNLGLGVWCLSRMNGILRVAVGHVGVGFAEDLLITFTGGGFGPIADPSTTSEEPAFLGTQKAFFLSMLF